MSLERVQRRRGRAAALLLVVGLVLAVAAGLALLGAEGAGIGGRAAGVDPAPAGPDGEPVAVPAADVRGAAPADVGRTGAALGPAKRVAVDVAEDAVRLRVVDASTDAPITRARLAVVQGGDAGDASVETGPDGWAALPATDPARGLVSASADGYATRTLSAALLPGGATIRLDPAGTLVVRAPNVQGVRVEILRGVTARFEMPAAPVAEPTRDGGSPVFRFAGLPPGHYSVGAHDGSEWLGGEVGVEVPAGATVRVAIDVEPRATFVAEVVEIESGRPIADVRARLIPTARSVFSGIHRELLRGATTASNGRFEVTGAPLGPARVELSLPDGSSVRRDVVVREGQEARVVTLRARGAAVLEGRLAAELLELAPAASWRVTARPREGLGDVLRTIAAPASGGRSTEIARAAEAGAAVDGTGRFVIERAPTARPLVVLATAAGIRQVGIAEVAEPLEARERREGVLVEALGGRALTLVASDPAGAPVREIEVSIAERVGSQRRFGGFRRHRSPSGRFEVDAVTDAVSLLRVRAEGFSEQQVQVPADADTIEVRLEPSRDVPVVLIDGHGHPVDGEVVLAMTVERVPGGRTTDGRRRCSAVTDAHGRATLDLDPRWAWDVGHAPERTWPTGEIERVEPTWSGSAPIVIVVGPDDPPDPARIRGRIVRPGRRRPIYDLRFLGLEGATVEVDGERFEIAGVPSGPVRIHVVSHQYETIRLPVDHLEPGESLDVGELVARPASRVEVVVEAEGGRRLQGASVRLERLPPDRGGRDDLPGRVDLERDPSRAGVHIRETVGRATWRLHVTHPGKAPITREVVVEARVERLHVTMKDT